jgi:hypothetical protein
MGSLDPDPWGQEWPRKVEKQLINFIFWGAPCSLVRAEGFSCCCDIIYGYHRDKVNCYFWSKNIFSAVFISQILIIKTLVTDPKPDPDHLKMLDPDPDWPQHSFYGVRQWRESSMSFKLSHTYVSVGHHSQRSFHSLCPVWLQNWKTRPWLSSLLKLLHLPFPWANTGRIPPSTERDSERGNEDRYIILPF